MTNEVRPIRAFVRILCLATLLSCPVLAAAEDPPPQADPAKDPTTEERLQQQEQRIKELEQRLEELESAAMSGKAVTPPAPAEAEKDKPEAEAEPPESTAEVRETHELLTGNDLVSAEFPGSWPMFGTDMRMKVGGYLKSDFVYDVDGTTDKYEFLMSTIPVEGTPEHENSGYVSFFSKESRINVDVRRVTPGSVPLRAFVEGDFFSSGNQFRLRHAYMTAGDFIIGQTWTTLSFLEALPFIIDFGAGDALFGGRTTQIRYQKRVNDQWKVAAGLENLDFMGIENSHNLPGKASAQLPLLAVRAEYKWSTGILLLGSSVAQLRWDGGADGPTADAIQLDAVVAGRQFLGEDNYVTLNVSYGKGSGENIMAFAGSDANAVLTEDGRLETMPAFAIVTGYWHRWNPVLSSNFSYAYGWLDTPESRDPLKLKRGGIGHLNLIWKPRKQFSAGVEFMWGAQRTTNDALGEARRVQMMAKYDF